MMITRKFLESLDFTVMKESDRMGFGGCESPVPLIAEHGDRYLVVIDGSYCEIFDSETLEMVDSVDNIRELNYTE